MEDWIAMCEHVSGHNRWDAMFMLANVIFYLLRTAHVWFDIHEDDLTSWETCKPKLFDLFQKPVGRRLNRILRLVFKIAGALYIAYIPDVLALRRKSDDKMAKIENVEHILKSIVNNLFRFVVFQNYAMV